MKKITLFIFASVFCLLTLAQNLSGLYQSTGYVFNPFSPSQVNQRKTLVQVATNRYQLELGNLGFSNFYFQFEVDASNNLVNWSAVGTTPASPASGFMTMDNPSGTSYPSAPVPPGVAPYIHSTYNNRYDPVNKVFYLHYGYATGSAGEFQYTRQVYEKLEWITVPAITSVAPLTGTAFTEVTIKGSNFNVTDPFYGVAFGGKPADSIAILSDTVIKAWAGQGASGNVIVRTEYYDIADTFPGFTYTPVPSVATTGWQYVGAAGFSNSTTRAIDAAAGKDNSIYVGFTDTDDMSARVMRFDGNNWQNIGGTAGAVCGTLRMKLDTADHPVVMYSDSVNNCNNVVKRFDGVNWIDLNLSAQFAVRDDNYNSLAIDGENNIFISYRTSDNGAALIKTLKHNGTLWIDLGNVPVWSEIGYDVPFTMAIGKDNNPYLLYPDSDSGEHRNQASIQMYNGQEWTQVGTRGFTSNIYINSYPVLNFDTSGNPVAALQEDNGFERLSVFRYDGNNINAIGRYFSRGRAWYISQAIGSNNSIHVAYVDASYNGNGTVLIYNEQLHSWDTVGARGALPFERFTENKLIKDSNNDLYIAFADATQNGRVSVMKYAPVATGFVWTGAVSAAWENPGNWSGGVVPSDTSDVYINAGGTVLVSSNAEAKRIHVNPGASITVTAGNSLTVFEP